MCESYGNELVEKLFDAIEKEDNKLTTSIQEYNEIIVEEQNKMSSEELIVWIIAFISLIIGIVYVSAPRFAWYINWGLHYKNAEPGELSLLLFKFGGIFLIILPIVIMLILIV